MFKRARQPEQKEQRRTEIVQAAAKLFERHGLADTSLSAIARATCISKAALYRYFESREAIFLELLVDDYDEWVAALERELAPLAGSNDERAIADVLVRTIAARRRLATLMAATASVLEQNLSAETVREFKQQALQFGLRVANALTVAMPAITFADARELLTTFHFVLVGLWPAANPPAAVRKALEDPTLEMLKVDFERELRAALVTYLRGLKAGAS